MPFKIVRNDLTKMIVDAIVNTANPKPAYASGTDYAVYKAAGEEELLEARKQIGEMKEGEVCITDGFRLPAKYIIHAVSPRFIDGKSGEEEKLRSCYQKSLQLASEYECTSIAFPLIATGSFGYPKEEGMRIALDEINAFLLENDMLVYLVVFDAESTGLGQKLYPELEAYIDANYVVEQEEEEYKGFGYFDCGNYKNASPPSNHVKMASRREISFESRSMEPDLPYFEDQFEEHLSELEKRMSHLSDTFQEYLMYLIEKKGLANADVYKRALVTKQLFSKIKRNPDYHPDKATALRLCVGAKLNLDETKDLLSRAGYALSPCDKRDVIISFFIEHQVYDMIEIDIALEEHGLPCFIE